jgi:hypothetical protein
MALTITRGKRMLPPRVLLYGVDGIGKTEFASLAPDPVFIFTEPGQGALELATFEATATDAPWEGAPSSYVMRSFESVLSCVASLYAEEHPYKTVVLDTLDAMEPMLWAHTSKKHGKENIEAFGYGKGYGFAVAEIEPLLQGLDALNREKNMTVLMLAHSQVKRYDAPDHEPFDRYQMRLHEKMAARVSYWADAVLFANYRTHIVRDAAQFGKTGEARGVGHGERLLYTEERPAWHAKNRYGLPPELPFKKGEAWNVLANSIIEALNAPQSSAASAANTSSVTATDANASQQPAEESAQQQQES